MPDSATIATNAMRGFAPSGPLPASAPSADTAAKNSMSGFTSSGGQSNGQPVDKSNYSYQGSDYQEPDNPTVHGGSAANKAEAAGEHEFNHGMAQEQQGVGLANQAYDSAGIANNYLQRLYGMSNQDLYNQQASDNSAASTQARQLAGLAGNGAAASAADAARSGGLNAGQAGLAGGQQVANSYTGAFTPALEQQLGQIQQNRNNQLSAAGQSGQLALGQGNIGLGIAGQGNQMLGTSAQNLANAAGIQQQNQNQNNAALGGMLGGGAQVLASLLPAFI